MGNEMADFVAEKRSSLFEKSDAEALSDVVGTDRRSGTRVALSLLSLGEVGEAQEWFATVSRKWAEYAQRSRSRRLERFDDPHVGKLRWRELEESLLLGVLSRDPDTIDYVVDVALEETSRSDVAALPGADTELWLPAIELTARVIQGSSPQNQIEALSTRLEAADRPHDRSLFGALRRAAEALWRADPDTVLEATRALDSYHEEFVVGSDTVHFVEERVNPYSCAVVAIGRLHGLDVRVDSEYVPDAVYDNEYYPLGDGSA